MSLITTCPACGTSFRVTPEQLAAHRGDVRCGKCQHIFSALKQLEEVVPAPLPPVEEPSSDELSSTAMPSLVGVLPAETTDPFSTPAVDEPLLEAPSEVEIEQALELEPLELVAPQTEPEVALENSPASMTAEIEPSPPEAAALVDEPSVEGDKDSEIQALSIDTATLDFEIDPIAVVEEDSTVPTPPASDTEEIELRSPEAWPEESDVAEAAIPNEPTEPEPQHEPTPQTAAPAQTTKAAVPSFLASTQPRRRPVVAALLAVLSLVLLLTLAVQGTYFMRNTLAARYPQWMPWLEHVCQPLQCKVELPRQAELLSIEDSDLQDDTDHDGVLVLRSMLDNRAAFTQALPLLELTLTDTGDLPVLRRTFTPHEYLPKEMSPEKGIAAGAQIQIRLNLVTEGIKPAGYRLYVRY